MIDLFTNRTTNGDGAAFSWPGGIGDVNLSGTFNGRELVTVMAKPDGKPDSEYKTVMQLNAGDSNVPHNFQLEGPHDVRANLQNAGTNPGQSAGTDINLTIA